MEIRDIPVPEIYKESADFRFFLKWFESALSRIKYDTENMFDLYDPLRCPDWLLWMLGDTVGYKYDDRLPTAFNRLVILYFMSMIRNRGSKDGVTLAAEVNLAQFSLQKYGEENPVLFNRLEDVSVPVNSVYVTPHTEAGYIDVVYFSVEKPIDACIEYVRPLGMYLFQHAGVRYDSRTRISVDARLTNTRDLNVSIGPTHVGHYRREDYARMQRMKDERTSKVNEDHSRNAVFYRNSEAEGSPDPSINPGYRSLYSLQLTNNDHIVAANIGPIFSLGFGPQNVSVTYPDDYLKRTDDTPNWNLRYDRKQESDITSDVYTVDADRTSSIISPRPAVNPIMASVGDAISLNTANTEYTKVQTDGTISAEDVSDS